MSSLYAFKGLERYLIRLRISEGVMVETFESGWLNCRESVDHRSRSTMSVAMVVRAWSESHWTRVLDIGAGTGSNMRYLAPRLPKPQRWTLVDSDKGLLNEAAAAPAGDVGVTTLVADVSVSVPALIEETNPDLVTASAFLDLVSEKWLRSMVNACCAGRRGALFSLTYDGSIQLHSSVTDPTPAEDTDDALVRRAVNNHQRRNKGFGPATGPMSSLKTETAFREVGYSVWLFQSRWLLGANDGPVVSYLIDGWAAAAVEECPGETARITAWADRRRETLASGEFAVSVGHLDLVALPGPV